MSNSSEWYAPAQSLPEAFSCEIRHLPIKRTFDILFSLAVLIFGFPVYLLIGLLVACSSSGKIIYSHKRVGRGGKLFNCYKFRTMYADADERLAQILSSSEELRKEWEENHKLKNDPRVTPIGSFLRKTSLDELPQFWNVLVGDLSVVGPRPVVEAEVVKHLGHKAPVILSIRPGLTGIWQVSGRSSTSYKDRIMFDEMYVKNHSLLLDIKLIAWTIPCMISSKGAY